MLKLYRRHKKSCSHTSLLYIKCRCRIWVQGTLNGRWIRQAMDITNWEDAQRKVREWETGVKEPIHISVKDAIAQFIADAETRNLATGTLIKYRHTIEKTFGNFCEQRRLTNVDQITSSDIIVFRKTWTVEPITHLKRFERIRSFFLFCERNGWCSSPCRALKPPKVDQKPTLPFTDEEMKRILEACEQFGIGGRYKAGNRTRVKAFVLLLRYSGIRITDAVTLERKRIENGRLVLRTAKTGTDVCVPLPEFVIHELESLNHFPDRFFWNGQGTEKSAVSVWERTMQRVFEIAGVPNGHCHMFRNTFAVSLLQKAVPIEDIAVLLGHQDVKVTWRSYSAFVKARQDRLEERVKATWS